MTRSELIQKLLVDYPHLNRPTIEKVVNLVFSDISDALQEGHRVELRGFGAFSVRERDARKGRNPRTGEPINVEEKKAIYFRMGKELKKQMILEK